MQNDPWALFDAGVWLIFVAWAIAFHLCSDDGPDPGRGPAS